MSEKHPQENGTLTVKQWLDKYRVESPAHREPSPEQIDNENAQRGIYITSVIYLVVFLPLWILDFVYLFDKLLKGNFGAIIITIVLIASLVTLVVIRHRLRRQIRNRRQNKSE